MTTQFDPKAASFYGQFVQATYSMYSADPSNLEPKASGDFPAGFHLVAWIQDLILDSTALQFYGFVAQSAHNANQFVVAIRGTSNWVEFWHNLNALGMTPFKTRNCGMVADGFARIYDTLQVVECPPAGQAAAAVRRLAPPAGSFAQQVSALVRRRQTQGTPREMGADPFSQSASVEITGHSLGAALATLYATESECTGQIANPMLCTFASPLVGDATFASVFNGLKLTSWRVDNAVDLGCWHSLATYLSLIDPTKQPEMGCRLPAGQPHPAARAVSVEQEARVKQESPTILLSDSRIYPLPSSVVALQRKIARYGRKLVHRATLPLPSAQGATEVVDAIAFAPPRMARGETFLVQVFLGRTEIDEEPVRIAALASDPSADKRAIATLDVEVAVGDRIDIRLEAQSLSVADADQALIWRGKPRSCTFFVTVPKDFTADHVAIQARLYRQSVPVGRIAFSTPIVAGAASEPPTPVGDLSRVYRRAFLSYAWPDRPEVIRRAQALQAANIDFFWTFCLSNRGSAGSAGSTGKSTVATSSSSSGRPMRRIRNGSARRSLTRSNASTSRDHPRRPRPRSTRSSSKALHRRSRLTHSPSFSSTTPCST
jgi:triacylglycerol lipase